MLTRLKVGFLDLMDRRPRLGGLLLMVLAGVFIAWNEHAKHTPDAYAPQGSFYPTAYLLGYPGALLGLWVLLTGRFSRAHGEPPRWWLAGACFVIFGGAGYGLYVLRSVHHWP